MLPEINLGCMEATRPSQPSQHLGGHRRPGNGCRPSRPFKPQIEGYVHEQAGSTCPLGLRIVGYYQCNERLGDSELGGGRRVADRIEAAFPDSVAVVVSCSGVSGR